MAALGEKIKVRVNRRYGPYADDRPYLQEGVYAAFVESISPSSGAIGLLMIEANGHQYTVESKDVTVL